MNIFIFETNVKTAEDVNDVKSVFNSELDISVWSVDLEDTDKILRIESANISPEIIENLLRKAGFQCQQLLY